MIFFFCCCCIIILFLQVIAFRADSMSAEETNIALHRRHSRSVLVNELSFSCEDADSCRLAWEMRPYRLFLSCHGGFRRPWFHVVGRPTNWSSQRITSSEVYTYFTIIHYYYFLLLQVPGVMELSTPYLQKNWPRLETWWMYHPILC